MDHVVVAWDGSAAAQHAAGWAADHMEGRGHLRLLRVVPRRPDGTEQAAQVAEAVSSLRRAHPTLDVTGSITHGDAETVLRRAADDASLLVLGTRPRTDPYPSTGRSFAIRVAARAVGRVVVVPDAVGSSGDRVVVGVDGSAASLAAALVGAQEAVRAAQPLVLVHAWWEAIGWDALLPFEVRVIESLEHAHRSVLDECADLVARRHPALEIVRLLVHAPTSDAIAEASGYASLVVLGRHSGAVAVPALLGASARALLCRASVPTMIVGAGAATALAAAAAAPVPALA